MAKTAGLSHGAPRPPRARRRLRVLAAAALLAALLVIGGALFVQRPAFREGLLARINRALEGSGRGHISLVGLDHLGLGSARLTRAQVTDEHGATVLTLEGVQLNYDLLDLLGPWLPLGRPELELDHVRVERTLVRLLRDPASGELTLARAFGKDRAATPGSGRTPLGVLLQALELGQVAIELDEPSFGELALRLNRVHASAALRGDATQINVQSFGVLLARQDERWVEGAGALSLSPAG